MSLAWPTTLENILRNFRSISYTKEPAGIIPRRARRNCFDYGCYRRRYVRPGIMRDFPTGAGQEIRQGSPPGRGV